MRRSTDVDALLLRRLAGELPPDRARELDRRLAAEPDLAARLRALERGWTAVSPAPASPLPASLTARVMAAVRRESEGRDRRTDTTGALSWRLAPLWVRAAAAVALAAGVAVGAGLGFGAPPAADQPSAALSAPGIGIAPPESLASSYWTAIEEATAEPETGTPGPAASGEVLP